MRFTRAALWALAAAQTLSKPHNPKRQSNLYILNHQLRPDGSVGFWRMKMKKGTGTAAAKRKSMVRAKLEHVVPSRTAASESRNGHWMQWIEPKGAAFITQTFGPIYFVMKNHGSNDVMLMAQNGDLMDLAPGAVRATYAYGTITVENRGEKRVLIEFDFLPFYKK
jgi:hypothetical protein